MSKNSDVGGNKSAILASLTGDEVDMYFNNKYLADCFQSINTESLTLGFSGPGRPVVVRGVSDQSFTYIVMPMNK